MTTLLLFALSMWGTLPMAAPPQTMSYQGFLTSSTGVPVNTTVQMVFRLWDAASGGTQLWTESQGSVTVSNGVFNVVLGSVNPLNLPFDAPYYVGVAVGGDAEMTPRQALNAAPYALFAANSACRPGDMMSCFEGPLPKLGVGVCKAGVRHCIAAGQGFGACTGQVLPAAGEVCTDLLDNNCDGAVNEGCAPQTCTIGQNATCGLGACFRSVTCLTGYDTCTPGSPAAETCNGIDDNCDGAVDNGSLCSLANATSACSSGACMVSSCSSGYADADGSPANGCEMLLDTNPACSGNQFLGSVSGDTGSSTVNQSGTGERWFQVNIAENDNNLFAGTNLTATVTLSSPPGVDYDLYVYCATCGNFLLLSSTNGAGATDTIHYSRSDTQGSDDGRTLLIEIRYAGGSSSANWSLSIVGNGGMPAVHPACP